MSSPPTILCSSERVSVSPPLPPENRELTPEEVETRKNWLFGLTPKARAGRYRVVEHMVHLKIELTGAEKLDRMYLKTLFMPGN